MFFNKFCCNSIDVLSINHVLLIKVFRPIINKFITYNAFINYLKILKTKIDTTNIQATKNV